MPPRQRRQSPERRDAAIRKHLPKAGEYWTKWPGYLAEGDLCQAGEKAWGAVAQLTKAVATHRGWQHSDHDRLQTELALEDIVPLVEVLWAELPGEYTGGISFDDWVASNDN